MKNLKKFVASAAITLFLAPLQAWGCTTSTPVSNVSETICAGTSFPSFSTWQTNVEGINGCVVYSSILPVAGSVLPDNYFPDGVNWTSNTITQSVSAYVYCDLNGNSAVDAGDNYLLISTYDLIVNPTPSVPNESAVICDGSKFTFSPLNNPPSTIVPLGTTFTWTVVDNPNVTGEYSVSTPEPVVSQILTNNTAMPQTVIYTITPTSQGPAFCVGNTFIGTVIVNPTIYPNFAPFPNVCIGSTPYALPDTSANGVEGVWWPATINTASLGTQTYEFYSTGGGDCLAPSVTVNITTVPNVTPTFTAIAPICNGGSFTLPTTSNNGISGTWSPAINNTATTTYTFTPNAGVCANTATMTVVVNPTPTPTFTQRAPICAGGINAPLPTTSNNGISGTWSPAMNNTVTTTYTFTPNAGICANTTTMTIVVNPSPTPNFNPVAPICSGQALSALPTTSTNGVTGTWSPALNNTATTTYTFTPTAGQCSSTTTLTITVNPNITPTFTAVAPICVGGILIPLPTTSNNGITGTWSPALNNSTTTTYTFTPSSGTCVLNATMTIVVNPIVTPTFTQRPPICAGAAMANLPTTSTNGVAGTWSPAMNNAATTTYTFTPNAGICANTATMTIVVNPIVIPTFNPVPPICAGQALSPLPTTSTNGITGTWSPALNNSTTTTYTFTPTAGQCSSTTTLTISVTPNITPTFTAVAPICVGGTLSPLPTTSNNGITGTWSPAMNNSATTTYTFTPSSGTCVLNATMTIVVNSIVTPTFTQRPPICAGAAMANLPTTSTNGVAGTWSPAMNNTGTTTYTFTPNAGICANTATMTIVVNPIVIPTFNPVPPICAGQALSPLPTTSTNGITGTWSPALNNTATTTYTFTPTAGQCSSTTTLTISVTPNITPTFTAVAPICVGGILSPLPTTSNNGITGTWSPALNNMATTTYTFTPSGGTCVLNATMTIIVNPIVTPTFTQRPPICAGTAMANLPTTSTNGVAGTWSPAMNNTATTTYTFTPNAGICANTATMTIVVNPIVIPTFNPVPPICAGQALSPLPTTSTNGITGTWSPALNNSTTTTYTFTPAAVQCAVTTTLTITVTPNITPTFTQVPPICAGDALVPLPTTSLNGITGTWSPAMNNTVTTTYTFTPSSGTCVLPTTMTIVVNPILTPTFTQVAPICAGAALAPLPTTSMNGVAGTWSPAMNNTVTTTYTFTSAVGACAVTTTMTIIVNPIVTPTFNPVPPICSGESLSALPTISTNGVTGTWSPALNNTATTTYTFTPAAAQCAVTTTLTITVTPNITPTFTQVPPICAGDALAPLPTTSLNGVAGTWSPAMNNMSTTTYTFTPSSGTCVLPATMTIVVNPILTPTFTQVAPICAGAALAPLPTTSMNGVAGTWSPAMNNTVTTSYTFTPAGGICANTETMTIVVNPIVTPTFNAVPPICSGESLSALPTISTNGVTGTWSPALNNTATTTYTFTPAAAQCAVTTTLTITVNPNITPTFTAVAPICVGEVLSPLPTTSNNGISGTWSPALNNMATTTYTFTPTTGVCSLVTTLSITVNQTVTSTTNLAICSTDLPYSWNGLTFASAGSQTATLVSSTSCDSLATLNLTVNPILTSNSNLTICPSQLPYSWNGLTFAAAGSQTATLTSSTNCDSLATLNLSVNPILTSTTNQTICNSQLPFSWNGLTFFSAGPQTATLTSSNGCDSLATLILSTNPISTSSTTITICADALPYSWNGLTFAAAGNQTATLVNAFNCDSLATLNLIVNPILTSSTNITICQTQLPYTWNGLTFASAGSQTATLTSSTNCDSLATMNLTVNPTLTSTTNTTICANQLPYSWNGLTFATAGTQTTTLVSSTNCDSLATLNLTVNPILSSTTNQTICNNQLPYSWNGLTFASAGTQTATLTSSFNCDSLATLNLMVNPTSASSTSIIICANELPFSWNGLTFFSAGPQTATLTNSFNCDSLATLTLTVNPVLTSTSNQTICATQLPYSWNGLSFAAAGSQTATLTSSFNCDSLATLNLVVNPTLTSTTNITICSNQLPYTWNGLSFAAAGTQTATLTSITNCDSLATLNLTVNPILSSTTNQTICNNQLPYTWNGLTFASSGTQTATLTSSFNCDSLATLNLMVNPTSASSTSLTICSNELPFSWNGLTFFAAGPQTATLTNSFNCDSLATLNLTVNPVVSSSTSLTICETQLPYSWNGLTFASAGTQVATLTSALNCDSLATLNLSVNPTLVSTTNLTICADLLPYSWNGLSFAAAGTQTATLTSITSCDSLATLNLTVNPILSSTTNQTICANQLPYSWNGLTFAAAGTQTTTLVSSTNCDSLATLNLSVNPILSSTTDETICANELPYSWNGLTFASAGSQTAILTSSFNCDSIATLNLTVNPILTSTTNQTICATQLPFSWNGLTFLAAGTQTATLTSSLNCDSLASLNLIVNPTLFSASTISVCVNELPYSWNGLTFNSGGSQTATLVSSTNCDSLATLNLIVNPILSTVTNQTICASQLPYSWNGLNFAAAGMQTATLTNIFGCDSLATLVLTVNPVLTSTTNTTICSNQLPYSWNGLTFLAAGSQTATLTSITNCDSLATLNLTVNPVLYSTTNQTICETQLPYIWNGITFGSAGTQIATLTSAANCDSLATLHLSVNPVTTSNTMITICSNELPYNWNGLTFNAAEIQTATLTNSVGCDSLATLDLSVNPVLTSVTNETICATQLPYSWNGLTFATAGSQTATLTSSFNCDSLATLNLTVNPILLSSTNITICENDLPYTWNGLTFIASGSQTATLISSTNCDSLATLNLTVNPILSSTTNITICNSEFPFAWNGLNFLTAGTQTATLTSSTNCDSLATLNLMVHPASTSNTNLTICPSELPYIWNGLTFMTDDTQTAILTNSFGCDSLATLTLVVTPTPTSVTNITICEYELPYTWNALIFNAAGTQSALYAIPGSCDSIATLNLTVTPNPIPNISANITLGCGPLDVEFTDNTFPLPDNTFWLFGNGSTSSIFGTQYQTYVENGCYTISYTTVYNGCTNTTIYADMICVIAGPVADFTVDNPTTNDQNPTFNFNNLSSNATDYEWNFGDGGISYDEDPSYSYPNSASEYNVMLIASNEIGCADTAYQTVTVQESLIYYVPNAFTPDADGKNESFKPVFTSGFDPFSYTLILYNRWGEMVFESHNTEIGWDGTYGGYPVQDGMYTWTIEFKEKNTDEYHKAVGHVTIIR